MFHIPLGNAHLKGIVRLHIVDIQEIGLATIQLLDVVLHTPLAGEVHEFRMIKTPCHPAGFARVLIGIE